VIRTSPLYDSLRRLDPTWGELNGMATARNLATRTSAALQLTDLSALRRGGLKGSAAASWLESRDIPVPSHANSWASLAGGGFIARLGRSEFLLEDGPQGVVVSGVLAGLGTPAADVYPVLRQDAALIIRGEAVHELLAQTCGIDFAGMSAREHVVTLTLLAGIAVTLIDDSEAHSLPCYRLWCDGTYGIYLWDTLLEIAVELGGGAVGFDTIYADASSNTTNAS